MATDRRVARDDRGWCHIYFQIGTHLILIRMALICDLKIYDTTRGHLWPPDGQWPLVGYIYFNSTCDKGSNNTPLEGTCPCSSTGGWPE